MPLVSTLASRVLRLLRPDTPTLHRQGGFTVPAKTATKTASKTKLIPLGDRLVIKPVVQEEVLASGIVIPDTAKEKPQQGEVLAAGPGRLDDDGKRIPMEVKVGDRVLYAKYSGQALRIDQEEYIVLSEKDVLCKVQA